MPSRAATDRSMGRTRRVCMGMLAAVAITTMPAGAPARADSLPPIWTGLFIGAHGGAGWGEADRDIGIIDEIDLGGGLGGLSAGYLWQSGAWVFGAEGEASWGATDGNNTLSARTNLFGVPVSSTLDVGADVQALYALKAKAGYAAGPWLLYATGGVAWADVEVEATATASIGGVTASQSIGGGDVLVGWTAGGGAAYRFSKGLSANIDVSHYSFSDDLEDGAVFIADAEIDVTVVRGGLTFHLN
ncbi:MAG: outer membrane beta-barrel protein [Hyphomicrobiaceae bacterium]|nr:outer membrane beta-barrel protein [Hyphomicrobiaceae bacterium]